MNIDDIDGHILNALAASERAALRGGNPGRRQFAAAIHQAKTAGMTFTDINQFLGGTQIDLAALADEYPPMAPNPHPGPATQENP